MPLLGPTLALSLAAAVAVVDVAGQEPCVSAEAFAGALRREGLRSAAVAQAPLAPDAVRAWLTRDAQGLRLHVSGPALSAWERRFPPARCEVQLQAAAIALLSLLDPLPLPVPPPAPPLQPPPPPPPAPERGPFAFSAVGQGRLLTGGRTGLGGGLGVEVASRWPLSFQLSGWAESPFDSGVASVGARSLEAALLVGTPRAQGWGVQGRAGLALSALRLAPVALVEAAPGWFLNPAVRAEVRAGRCREGWCVDVVAGAQAWLRREDLLVDETSYLASTPWGALDVGLAVSWRP